MAKPLATTSIETQAVHAGREVLHEQGIHAMPIDLSSTYPLHDLDEGGRSLEAMAMGGLPIGSPVYSRLYNPTVARYEQALAQMEGAEEAVAFGSGMAAVTACLMAAKQRGGHVVAVRPLYGGTDHLLASGMLGLEVSWAEADGIAAALRPDTAMVIVETPANPTLAMVDLDDVVRQAGKVPVLVDGDLTLTESVAISLYLAEKYPSKRLIPEDGTEKADVYRWLLFAATGSGVAAAPVLMVGAAFGMVTETVAMPVTRDDRAAAGLHELHEQLRPGEHQQRAERPVGGHVGGWDYHAGAVQEKTVAVT